MLICFMVLAQTAVLDLSLALLNAGNRSAARIAMIATTTSNSMSVKPNRRKDGRMQERKSEASLSPVRTGLGILPIFQFSITGFSCVARIGGPPTARQARWKSARE